METKTDKFSASIVVEKEKRILSGRRGHFNITSLEGDHPFFSLFSVKSDSFLTYFVDIHSLTPDGSNYCSCPDYKLSHLGSCKHIHAVLSHLKDTNPQAYAWSEQKQPVIENSLYGTWNDGKPSLHLSLPIGTELPFYEDLFIHNELRDISLLNSDEWSVFLDVARKNRIAFTFSAREIIRIVTAGDIPRNDVIKELKKNPPSENILGKPLKSHQLDAVNFIIRNSVSLIEENAGTGKRISSIASIAFLMRKISDLKIVVLTNEHWFSHWKRLFKIFLPVPVNFLDEIRGVPQNNSNQVNIYIGSYKNILRDAQKVHRISPTMVIFDEIHTVHKWNGKTGALIQSLKFDWSVFLSSSKIPVGSELMVNLLHFMKPEKVAPFWKFNTLYSIRNKYGKIIDWKIPNDLIDVYQQFQLSRDSQSLRKTSSKRSMFRVMIQPGSGQKDFAGEKLTRLFASSASRFSWTPSDISNAVSEIRELRISLGSFSIVSKNSYTPKIEILNDLLETWGHTGENINLVIFTHFKEIKQSLLTLLSPKYAVSDFSTEFDNSSVGLQVKILCDHDSFSHNSSNINVAINYEIPWEREFISARREKLKKSPNGLCEYNLVVTNSIEERALILADGFPTAIGEWFDGETQKNIDPAKLKNLVRKLCGKREERLSSSKMKIERTGSYEKANFIRRSGKDNRTLSSERLFGTTGRNRIISTETEIWSTGSTVPDFSADEVFVDLKNILDEKMPIMATAYSSKTGNYHGFAVLDFAVLGNALISANSVVVISDGISAKAALDLAFGSISKKINVIDVLGIINKHNSEVRAIADVTEATLGVRSAWDDSEIKRLYESGRFQDIMELGKSSIKGTWALMSYLVREMMFFAREGGERLNYIVRPSEYFNRGLIDSLKSKTRI
ncbi:MAG: hypothetical protein JXR95_07820 [Deltaproteobacteria bacterium]|nr:hypothetical protein [Deltaproteobacteria bacterium]